MKLFGYLIIASTFLCFGLAVFVGVTQELHPAPVDCQVSLKDGVSETHIIVGKVVL